MFSDIYIDLSDNDVDLLDLYVALSDNFVFICIASTGQKHISKIISQQMIK